jgi:hypothetical protein
MYCACVGRYGDLWYQHGDSFWIAKDCNVHGHYVRDELAIWAVQI